MKHYTDPTLNPAVWRPHVLMISSSEIELFSASVNMSAGPIRLQDCPSKYL